MTPPDPEPGYRRALPYVVCASNGGPYDDDAFAAGRSAADLDRTLEALAALTPAGLTGATVRRHVAPRLLPQLDLIAMQHGFTLAQEPWAEHPDEWTLATFTLTAPVEGS